MGLELNLTDTEWPFTYTDHDREIVRAIVYDGEGFLYFMGADRDDIFGKAVLIETAGGGVEPGEDTITAIKRELREELGAEIDSAEEIGFVSDYYNLIHRHNLNHYFLCRADRFGERHLTEDEKRIYHLFIRKLRYDDAERLYRELSCTRLGRLIANRELPILHRAKELAGNLF